MTLSGDAVLSGNGGIDVFNSNRNEEGTVSAQVEITGGRIETKDFPVSGNNQESAGAEVAITGGSLKIYRAEQLFTGRWKDNLRSAAMR